MSDEQDSEPGSVPTRSLEEIAKQLAGSFIHDLTLSFRSPVRLVCPSDEAEQHVVNVMTQAATAQGIPFEVIDLRLAPVMQLDTITARLDGWEGLATNKSPSPMPTLLILCGFDAFGDDAHDGPTYPFRSKFQFDQKFLWLFVGRDTSRMQFLFGSRQRPLYLAAGDITPDDWQPCGRRR